MKLFIDAHALIWAIYAPEHLSATAQAILEDKQNDLLVSDATLWELLNKIGRGKLRLAGSSPASTFQRISDLGVTFLPIEQRAILSSATLPHHHSDPFDRMIVAQAKADNFVLVTADKTLTEYGVSVLPA